MGEGSRSHLRCLHQGCRRLPLIRARLGSSWCPGEAASDSFPAPQPACPPGLGSYKHQPVLRGASTEHPPLAPDGEETFLRSKRLVLSFQQGTQQRSHEKGSLNTPCKSSFLLPKTGEHGLAPGAVGWERYDCVLYL